MLRFGSEKALTKPAPDENMLKCHVPMEDSISVKPDVTDMIEKNTLALYSAQFNSVGPRNRSKPKLTNVRNNSKMNSFKGKLGRIMHKLHDLESGSESERQFSINLGDSLYQMEDY